MILTLLTPSFRAMKKTPRILKRKIYDKTVRRQLYHYQSWIRALAKKIYSSLTRDRFANDKEQRFSSFGAVNHGAILKHLCQNPNVISH